MHTTRTGSWVLKFGQGGVVVDVTPDASVSIYRRADDAVRRKVLALLNADVAAGVAPREPATWGYEYYNAEFLGAGYWVSYLQIVWFFVEEGDFTEEKRVTMAKRLEDLVDAMLKIGSPPNRIRTTVEEDHVDR